MFVQYETKHVKNGFEKKTQAEKHFSKVSAQFFLKSMSIRANKSGFEVSRNKITVTKIIPIVIPVVVRKVVAVKQRASE